MWYPLCIHAISLLGGGLLTWLALHPVVTFGRNGWFAKKEDIFSSFTKKAKELYFRQFRTEVVTSDQVDAAFARMYEQRFGRRNLYSPMFQLGLIVFALTFLVVETAVCRLNISVDGTRSNLGAHMTQLMPLITLPSVALSAIIGAYLWITAGLIRRRNTLDLVPTDLQNAALRLVVAAPMGYALGVVFDPALGNFMAFAFGAFPLSQVTVILRRVANKKGGLELGSDDADGQLKQLEGIDGPTADRLLECGLTTVAQLAYCDPVQLCMRSGLTFNYISDIVSQALAWIYLKDALACLRPFGLRGAVEMTTMHDRLQDANDNVASALLVAAAGAAGIDPAGLRNAILEIGGDPYSLFLVALWNGDSCAVERRCLG